MSFNRNLLNIIIILCVCLNWDCSEGAQEKQRRAIDSHTIQLSSLFPSSSSPCVLSTRASSTKSSLHVTHRHGTCSRITSAKAKSPDHAEILRLDQARVNSIHSKLSKKLTDRVRQSKSTDLPAKDGSTYGSGNFVVTLGIGTPKHDLSLIFDTGSDLTWIQCEPCVRTCYSQKEPIFNPSSSSSYHNVSCSSAECSSLSSATGNSGTCSASNCVYGIQYGDQSFSVGFLAKEKFTLTASNVFDGVNFGCGENNQGLFTGVAGLLGLGRDKLSFPSQTAATYNKIFSYCLPSSASYTGHLTFGSAGVSRSVKFTPISTITDGTSFYGLDIVGISVGGQKLAIPPTVFSTPGALIDSGTVISRLPPKAYAALRGAFKAKMSQYKNTSAVSILDTCYDLTGLKTVTIPTVSFYFNGGAVVQLGSKGVLYAFKMSQVCLAFAGNSDDNNAAIFGNVQQQTLEVVYDGAAGRVGFAPNGWGCTDAVQNRESGEIYFHRIQVSSIIPSPSSSCVLSPRASNTKSSLHVVHRLGPCSSLSIEKARTSPDHDDILRLDQARVKSIHSKLSKKQTAQYRVRQSQSTDLRARDGFTIGSPNYIVTVGIGTPKHDFVSGLRHKQRSDVDSMPAMCHYRNCLASNCVYGGARHGDKTLTSGLLAKEKFTINSDVFDSVNFGCGENNQGSFLAFYGAAGLLGLGRGEFSFPSQTAMTYNNIFSYCLPSSPEYTGHLTFGSGGLSNAVQYTSISTVVHESVSIYGLDIVGISVAGKKLEIPVTVFSTAGAIIDSGTVITRLPPKAYAALRTAFKKKMSNYKTTLGSRLLDTCYDFTGQETVDIPKVSFSFKGGTVVELHSKGILFAYDVSQVCLAFAKNSNVGNVAIFGNVQQKTLQVVYDGAGGRVGFAPNGSKCSSLFHNVSCPSSPSSSYHNSPVREEDAASASAGSNTKEPLHVVDKHVVRSPLMRSRVTRLDLDNILRHDRARLDYIHSRLSNNFAERPRKTESKDIPVKDMSKSKSELGWGSYIETIGNGNT
uniref:Peptidase A1 domain-containing protein n=1 Tax=Brassica campestris TaxID=3711 RepID=M4CXQ9_BRACM